MAIGPSNYCAVVCEDSVRWYCHYCGPDNFETKVKGIDCSEIKHISFGYNDQWAITMKNGWCHASLQPGLYSMEFLSDCFFILFDCELY